MLINIHAFMPGIYVLVCTTCTSFNGMLKSVLKLISQQLVYRYAQDYWLSGYLTEIIED